MVFVRTTPDTVRCRVEGESIGCQTGGPDGYKNSPYGDRKHINNVSIISYDLTLTFSASNMQTTGDADSRNDRILTPGQVLQIHGWTVEPDANGIRFTDDNRSHGMYVTVDTVTAF
jgi:hypothetical protein